MSDLGTRQMLTPSGITRVVTRLEERGLVRREPDPADGRAAFAALTKTRLEALRRAQVIHHATVRELSSGGSHRASSTASLSSSRRRYRASSAPPSGPRPRRA